MPATDFADASNFPSWRFPPPNEDGSPSGEGAVFKTPEDVPAGWTPSPHGMQAAVDAMTASFYKPDGTPVMERFPTWRFPPNDPDGSKGVLCKTADDVPPGWVSTPGAASEEALNPAKKPAKEPAKEPATPAKAEAKKAAKTDAPTPVPMTREAAIAELVASYGFQPDDPDMADASDEAVFEVLKVEAAKRVKP